METNLSSPWVKKFRILTLCLIFSGALNIGLLAAFIFFMLKEKQVSFSISRPAISKGKQEPTNTQLFASMEKLTFRELVSFLTNKEMVEEGFSKRDLAVAALVGFHNFNIEKALTAAPLQKRVFEISDHRKIEVFPGLSEDQFEAIIRYAYQEKWPLTSKGLFALLQKWDPAARDESLEQAFWVTPEFYSLQVLFQKTEAPQSPTTLLDLSCEGNWDLLERFHREQSQMLDLSVDKRRRLLLSYLALQSPTAAHLLLKTDFVFALKKLEDKGILDLIALLKNKTEESERFCVELLRSPRSDAIWQAAAIRLYGFVGESLSTPLDPKEALIRFASNAITPAPVQASTQAPVQELTVASPKPIAAVVKPPSKETSNPATLFHIVKEGESLWKIARQYKVKLEELVSSNELEKDRLFPGMTLRIPQTTTQGTGSEPPR